MALPASFSMFKEVSTFQRGFYVSKRFLCLKEVSFVFHDFAELGVRHAPAGGADVAAVVCSCY